MRLKAFFKYVAAALFLLIMSAAANAQLNALQWQNRIVLVFTPTPEDARVGEVFTAFRKERAGFKDRDLRLFIITGTGSVVEPPFSRGAKIKLAAAALHKRYGISTSEFAVLLLGKDGGVKFRSTQAVGPDTIFGEIDQMPMRRREMNRQ